MIVIIRNFILQKSLIYVDGTNLEFCLENLRIYEFIIIIFFNFEDEKIF